MRFLEQGRGLAGKSTRLALFAVGVTRMPARSRLDSLSTLHSKTQ